MHRVIKLGVVIYILLVLALAGTNGTLLALMIPFMIYLGTGFIFNPGKLNLDVNRTLSKERAFPGEEIDVHVTITNHGSSLDLIQIKDCLANGLNIIGGFNHVLTSLSTGESVSLCYTISGSRGLYHFNQLEILVEDSLQVNTEQFQIQTKDRLFIQPETFRIDHLKIRPRRTRVYSGYIPARSGGSGVEFYGVREYQHGDPLRSVNWRASARHTQKIFINEFEQERVADIGIILDTRLRSQIVPDSGNSLFEFSVQAASALAETFLKDGNRVGLLLYGTLLDWTLPDYGKVQRERILKRLSSVQPGESLVFDDLEYLPTRLLPPNSQIVFISPLIDKDLPILINLRVSGYAVMVISPNPIQFERSHLSDMTDSIKTGTRLAILERSLMLKKLQQSGVQILDWHTKIPLDQALSIALTPPVPILAVSS